MGVSHNQTRQQWSGNWTNFGAMQIAVSTGGGKFSCGHKDEQAWWPFWSRSTKRKLILITARAFFFFSTLLIYEPERWYIIRISAFFVRNKWCSPDTHTAFYSRVWKFHRDGKSSCWRSSSLKEMFEQLIKFTIFYYL